VAQNDSGAVASPRFSQSLGIIMKKIFTLCFLLAPGISLADCNPIEEFDVFYEKFRSDDEFKVERTKFPLIKRVLSGEGPDETVKVFKIEKNKVLKKEELIYIDQAILKGAAYSEFFFKESETKVRVGVGEPGSEPMVVHKFQNVSGCWYLVEYVDHS
jgi:hypothetical protein